MSDESVPKTDPELLPILNELAPQEPIFHRAAFASSLADFDRLMIADFWEFGASGRRGAGLSWLDDLDVLHTRQDEGLEILRTFRLQARWKELEMFALTR